jgi:predicted PurR-regulated permease PerM
MHFNESWYVVSTIAFLCAILALLATGFFFVSLVGKLSPLLQDTHDEILDLGDIAANTVGHASDTLDIVEQRVTETMGQAEAGARSASSQVIGVGSALAGLYLVVRFVGMLRGSPTPKPRSKPFWRKLF